MRDASREVSLYRGALPQASSESLAAQLLGRFTTASQRLIRAEVQLQLQRRGVARCGITIGIVRGGGHVHSSGYCASMIFRSPLPVLAS